MNTARLALLCLAVVLPIAVVRAQPSPRITVLYSTVPGDDSSLIPGSSSVRFAPISGSFVRSLDVTASGRWAIIAGTQLGGAIGQVIVRDGLIVERRSDPQPFAGSPLTWTSMDTLALNGNGDLAVLGTVGAVGRAIALLSPPSQGTISLLSGTPVSDRLPGFPASSWNFLGSPILTDSGMTGGWGDLTGAPTNANSVAFLGNTVLAVEGTAPSGSTAGVVLEGGFEQVASSPDASTLVVWARTMTPAGPSGLILVNGMTALQGDVVIPGSGFTSPVARNPGAGFREAGVDGSGRWFALGSNTDGLDWIVQDGVVIATSDGTQEVVAGSGEVWTDASSAVGFFAFDSNLAGDLLIGGFTNAPSMNDAVLVRTSAGGSSEVIARQGDPVDLDGNGLLDDGVFVLGFEQVRGSTRLLPDGSVLSSVLLADVNGSLVGRAFVPIGVLPASCAVSNGSGVNPIDLSCVTEPRLGTTWQLDITINPDTVSTTVLIGLLPSSPFTIPGIGPSEFLVDLSAIFALAPTSPGSHVIDLPRPALRGVWNLPLHLQGLRLDSVGGIPTLTATNRIDAVVGF